MWWISFCNLYGPFYLIAFIYLTCLIINVSISVISFRFHIDKMNVFLARVTSQMFSYWLYIIIIIIPGRIFSALIIWNNVFLSSAPSNPTVHGHAAGPISTGGSHSGLPLWGKWLPPAGDCLDAWGQSITHRSPPCGPVFRYSPHHSSGRPWRGPVWVSGSQPCGDCAHRRAARHPAER